MYSMMYTHVELAGLIFILRTLGTVGQIPFQVSSVANVTAVFGRNATLRCPHQNNHDEMTIAWIRYETRTILSMHGQKVIQSDRYVIESKDGTYHLFITGIVEEDEGTYICQINSVPMQNNVIHLKVMRSPRIEMTYPTGNDEVAVDAGGTVTLRCSALGNPKPTLTWKRLDGQPLRIVTKDGTTKKVYSVNGTTLILRAVRQIDSGDVICIAANGYLPIVSHKFILVVQYKPIVTLQVERVFVNGKPTVTIVCKVEAVPLPEEARISIKGEVVNSLRKVTDKNRLEFHVDKVDDFGAEVECLVKNVVGEVISATIIPEREAPKKHPEKTRATEVTMFINSKVTPTMNTNPEETKSDSGQLGGFLQDDKNNPESASKPFLSVVMSQSRSPTQLQSKPFLTMFVLLIAFGTIVA